MCWGRQILKWRPDPRDAFAATCYLVDVAFRKRPGVPEWLAEQAAREVGFRAAIASDPPPEFDRYR